MTENITIKNTILLLCDECGAMTLTPREKYEHGKMLKKAVFLKATCADCQVPGNFYGEEEEYYGEDGCISWIEEEKLGLDSK